MALYGLSKDNFLSKISEGLTHSIKDSDVFGGSTKLSTLKRIDKIFEKGLVYYIDPSPPIESKGQSIFFRKDVFNSELSLGSRQIVNRFEESKLSFLALSKLIDYKIDRKIPIYGVGDKPKSVAEKVRFYLYPELIVDDKTFLNVLIEKLAEYNILVFEFSEVHNKREKANVKGMFLAPNVIVLKKNTNSYKQEIFTLAHELGHYLLNNEEIDDNTGLRAQQYINSSNIEKWCSDFAYYFLIGRQAELIDKLEVATAENDYHHATINFLAKATHLSRSALYTRLLLNDTVDYNLYKGIIEEIDKKWLAGQANKKAKLEEERLKLEAQGKELIIQQAKPINSPLYVRTLKGALYNGLITEKDFCDRLNIQPSKLEQYLA